MLMLPQVRWLTSMVKGRPMFTEAKTAEFSTRQTVVEAQ